MTLLKPEAASRRSHARRYDEFAFAQRLAAEALLRLTRESCPAPQTILEPGCGTGLYTALLLDAFPHAALHGIDLCADAVVLARARLDSLRTRFAVANAERFFGGPYDLISSNATFQWFTDLASTVQRFAGMLTSGGAMTFSYFGPHTYAELQQAMREALGDDARTVASQFAPADTVEEALCAACARSRVLEVQYQQIFPSLRDLLMCIRHTGARGVPPGRTLTWTPAVLSRIEEAYRARHGNIVATYQVLLCAGEA
jgi:malonyl-CoA O-methyltransferase